MKTLLKDFGFSGHETEKLLKKFGRLTLEMLATAEGRETLGKVVDPESVKAAHMRFCSIYTAPALFGALRKCGLRDSVTYRLLENQDFDVKACEKALSENPYSMIFDADAPLLGADTYAYTIGFEDNGNRLEAAIYYVLTIAEKGTEENAMLLHDEVLDAKLAKLAGSTCLPMEDLLDFTESLLDESVSRGIIKDAVMRLHNSKRVLITKQKNANGKEVSYVYRRPTADTEIRSAKEIKSRLAGDDVECLMNPYEAIDLSQAKLKLYLSYEQVEAVYNALTKRISVITGGPGTGKTATQKVLIDSFKRVSGGKSVRLMAPTGQASKRMSEATGHPASTIHSALGIMPGETDPRKGNHLDFGLIIVDESSMIDGMMFDALMRHVSHNARIVFVGDVDQMPSIGAGCVLRELIRSGVVPVTRLTKVFRQGDDSDIAFNAARINKGVSKMIEGDKFTFIDAEGSEQIQAKVCEMYAKLVAEQGIGSVAVLTPYRRSTPTGVNELNIALRKALGKDKGKFTTYDGIRFYEEDKILFLRNRNGLVNGQAGTIEKVWPGGCQCRFGDKEITLSGMEMSLIVPALAQTIHKAQGEEYPSVILVCDSAHERMLSKNLVFTGLTRAKKNAWVIGERSSYDAAISGDQVERFSNLGSMSRKY